MFQPDLRKADAHANRVGLNIRYVRCGDECCEDPAHPVHEIRPNIAAIVRFDEAPKAAVAGAPDPHRGYARRSVGWVVVQRDSAALRIASTSARSCALPLASFAAIRSSREMKLAFSPLDASTRSSTRRGHAASNSTPGIAVRISTLTGALPIRKNGPGSAKSAGVKPCSGAPNSARAVKTALAFSASAFTRMSRSLVARGCA